MKALGSTHPNPAQHSPHAPAPLALRRWWMLVVLVLGLGLTSACIEYPNCENDEHCEEKGEYCLNQKCAQCRQDNHCDRGNRCVGGACEAIAGWCESESECGDGMRCKNNICSPECSVSADCSDGKVCTNGKCAFQCATNDDCKTGELCNAGRCIASTAAPSDCTSLSAIYFDYDESKLRQSGRDALRHHNKCIKKENRPVRIAGHCDERGTEEYNIALGERRARAARDYMVALGADRGKISIISYGESRPAQRGSSDSAYQANRRCEFEWR